MSKIVELNSAEIENVVGGITVAVTASASRYPAPTDINLPMHRLPSNGTMNQPPAPRPPRPAPGR